MAKSNKTVGVVLGIIIVIVAFFGYFLSRDEVNPNQEILDALPDAAFEASMEGNPTLDSTAGSMSEEEMVDFDENVRVDISGAILDVTGGTAAGSASAVYREKTGYMLGATVSDLPELEEGYFYEGWIVRQEPFDFISTGELTVHGDGFGNYYTSDNNYLTHNMYIITLEPRDGDPAPAEHVVEGVMRK